MGALARSALRVDPVSRASVRRSGDDNLGMERIHSVYVARGMYRGRRCVLYVGRTSRGMTRFHEHAAHKEWWPLVSSMSWYHRATREAASKTELRLIKQLCPVFNGLNGQK